MQEVYFLMNFLVLNSSCICPLQPLNHLKWMLEWFIGNSVWLLVESNFKFLWHLSWAFASDDGKCWRICG
jgi:hypothetical protein